MSRLGDNESMADAIKTAPQKVAKALDYIISLKNRRLNQKLLNEFTGFSFVENDDEYEEHANTITQSMNLNDLIAVATLLNLNYDGHEEVLSRRIVTYLIDFENTEDNSNVEIEDEAEVEEDIGTAGTSGVRAHKSSAISAPNFSLSFRDLEDSIKPFDGESSYTINCWIEDFEDLSRVMHLNDLQMLVFAKKSLKGLAKLHIQSEKRINTWTSLKNSLRKEFGKTINSADLHLSLSRRKLLRNESVLEYLLKMKELASRGYVEEEALIQYIVDGLPDEVSKKISLYEAKNLSELKEKLQVYARIFKKEPSYNVRPNFNPSSRGIPDS